jgi:outer membrane protein assembly factor BamB
MRKARLIAILTLGLASATHAENWPQWRGPAATGMSSEKGLPLTWSATENVAWKTMLNGQGISSPIVWGDRVIVTSQKGRGVARAGPRLMQGGDAAGAGEVPLGGSNPANSNAVTFLVTALDRATGRLAWEFSLDSEGQLTTVHEKHNLATPSPATDGQRVYAWFGTGQLVALDMTGKLIWKKNLATEYGPFNINWGHGSSPVVVKDMLVLQCYHPGATYLLSLDSATGKVRWKVDGPRNVTSYSTPFAIDAPAGTELVVNSSEGLSGHNAATGERLWHIAESNNYPIPTALQHDGIIYTSRGYRSGPFLAIRPGGKGDVSQSHIVWKVQTGAPYVSSLAYLDGLLYMIGDVGVASVFESKSGTRVWQERIGGVYTASPIAGDGKIYFFSEDGETVVLAAGREPRVVARNKLGVRQLASPAVSGGRLFIRSDDAIYAIGK